MINTQSFEQRPKTGNLDANLILRQTKLDLLFRFIEVKSNFPNLPRKSIAQHLGDSGSTIKEYRGPTKRPSTYIRKTSKRKKMRYQDGSITIKGGNCEIDNEFFSGKEIIDKAFNKNLKTQYIETQQSKNTKRCGTNC